MRFSIELELTRDRIQKDKNRLFISLLIKAFYEYDVNFFNEIYGEHRALKKEFTFAAYMGHCEFLEEEIQLSDKKIRLNISTYSHIEGIMIYNSFLKLEKEKKFCPFGNGNEATVTNIKKRTEKNVRTDGSKTNSGFGMVDII